MRAFLQMDDGALFPCKATVSSNGGNALNEPAIALGTIVRQQPDASAVRIERLPENEPVRLVAEAGNYLNDYQWFEIEYGEGRRGFAWGGTLCVDSELAGVLIDCRVHAGRLAAATDPEIIKSLRKRQLSGGVRCLAASSAGKPMADPARLAASRKGNRWKSSRKQVCSSTDGSGYGFATAAWRVMPGAEPSASPMER